MRMFTHCCVGLARQHAPTLLPHPPKPPAAAHLPLQFDVRANVYTLVAVTGVILFWRGVWNTWDSLCEPGFAVWCASWPEAAVHHCLTIAQGRSCCSS